MAQPQGQFNPLAVASGFDPKVAQISGALKSGYSGNKGLRFLGNVLAGLSNFRSGGLVGVGSTIADRISQQSYLDQLQQAQIDELNRTNAMYTQAANDLNLPTVVDPRTGIKGFHGGKEVFETLTPAYSKRQTNQYSNSRINGIYEDAGPLADPNIIRDYTRATEDRRAKLADSATNMGIIEPFYGTGYDRNPSSERAWNPVQQAIGKAMQQAATSATPSGQAPMLQAGASASGNLTPPPNFPLYGLDPFTMGAASPDVALKSLNSGQSARGDVETEKDKDTQLTETAKHNRAMEKTAWYNATHKGGGGGRAMTDLEAMSPAQRQAYLDKKAGLGPAAVGNLDSNALKFGQELWKNLQSTEQNTPEFRSALGRYNKWANRYGEPPAKPTFGGTSQQKLQNAGVNASTKRGQSSSIPGLKFE